MEAHIFRLPVAARPPTNNAARRKAGLRVCLFFIRGANASKAHHKSKSFPGLKKQAIRRQPLTGSRYNSRLFKKAEKKARLQARHKQLSGNRRGSTLSPLPSAGAGQQKTSEAHRVVVAAAGCSTVVMPMLAMLATMAGWRGRQRHPAAWHTGAAAMTWRRRRQWSATSHMNRQRCFSRAADTENSSPEKQ